MVERRSVRNLLEILGLAVVYLVAGKLSLLLAFVHASATAVWPPTGIALAACLLLGFRAWPGILLGAFLVNITTAGSIATSIGISIGNTLEPVVGAYLVNRLANGWQAFERPQDVFSFSVLAGLVSTTISATCGVTSLSLGGYADWSNFEKIWLTWWLGDAGGALVVTPLLVLWSKKPQLGWTSKQRYEIGLLIVMLVVVGESVFGGWLPVTILNYPLAFLCIPILVWTAFRFSPRKTATANFLLCGLAIWGTLQGYGPFVREEQNESLLLLQGFMGPMTIMALALAAGVAERQRVAQQLQAAIMQIKTLRGLLPICASCKMIRNNQGYWEEIENYIKQHSDAEFSHGLCPDCLTRLYPGMRRAM